MLVDQWTTVNRCIIGYKITELRSIWSFVVGLWKKVFDAVSLVSLHLLMGVSENDPTVILSVNKVLVTRGKSLRNDNIFELKWHWSLGFATSRFEADLVALNDQMSPGSFFFMERTDATKMMWKSRILNGPSSLLWLWSKHEGRHEPLKQVPAMSLPCQKGFLFHFLTLSELM